VVLNLFLFGGFCSLFGFPLQACAFWDHLVLGFGTSFFLVFEGDIRISMTCALELSFSFHFLGISGKARE